MTEDERVKQALWPLLDVQSPTYADVSPGYLAELAADRLRALASLAPSSAPDDETSYGALRSFLLKLADSQEKCGHGFGAENDFGKGLVQGAINLREAIAMTREASSDPASPDQKESERP